MTMPGNGWSASPLRYGGDRGSIAKSLVQRRWQRGLHRLSGIGRNVKDPLLPLLDKVLLRKRSIMETLFAKLKSAMGLEHSRHRSPIHAFIPILILSGGLLPGPSQGQHRHRVPIPGLSSSYPGRHENWAASLCGMLSYDGKVGFGER